MSEDISRLERKVFRWSESEADKRYIKTQIVEYLNDRAADTLTQTMWDAIHKVNGDGKTVKYLYFNERSQKLYLDRDFWEWAKLMCQLINEELLKLES